MLNVSLEHLDYNKWQKILRDFSSVTVTIIQVALGLENLSLIQKRKCEVLRF